MVPSSNGMRSEEHREKQSFTFVFPSTAAKERARRAIDTRFSSCRIRKATTSVTIIVWSRRLTVRTPGFHPGNRGSIPLGITKERTLPSGNVFSLVDSRQRIRTLGVRTGLSVQKFTPKSEVRASEAHPSALAK